MSGRKAFGLLLLVGFVIRSTFSPPSGTELVLWISAGLISMSLLYYTKQEPAEYTCNICGSSLELGQKKCGYCGHALRPAEIRIRRRSASPESRESFSHGIGLLYMIGIFVLVYGPIFFLLFYWLGEIDLILSGISGLLVVVLSGWVGGGIELRRYRKWVQRQDPAARRYLR